MAMSAGCASISQRGIPGQVKSSVLMMLFRTNTENRTLTA
jgi:hypothetical protein